MLGEELDREIPLNHLRTLFRVGMAGDVGIDQGELQRAIGLSSAGISRTVRALSRISYDKKRAGYDVVEYQRDPIDNRRRVIRLTANGKALFEKLAARFHPQTIALLSAV